MKRCCLVILSLFNFYIAGMFMQAQSAFDFISRNRNFSASNYCIYPDTVEHIMTDAPAGKKPFYISHYGRHGSRYLSNRKGYDIPYRILTKADSCIQLERPSVHLRYGHEIIVMPLVCLLELNDYGYSTGDLESLERHEWADYRIFPMAANVQFIFYRSNPQDDDVLVKVLLNENEVRLPLKSIIEPYYRWRDVREYYLQKMRNEEGGTRNE